MATTPVQDLTNIGNITDGDKLVGERVDGTTVRITFNGVLYDTDFTTNGFITRTTSATYANRTHTGTADRITITNGDGVSGNPTYDIASTYVGQATITTLGTISTGVWNGAPVTVAYGGTGLSSTTAYAPLFGGTTSTGAYQSGTAGTSGQLLQSGGASAIAGWTTATYPTTASTLNKRLKSDGTNLVMSTTTMPDSGTSGKFIIGDGSNYVESTSTIPASAGATALKYLRSDGTNYVLSTATISDTPSTTGKRLRSDGTNWITSTTTMPDTGTSGKLLRGDGTNYVETTSTFADTYTASSILYSNGSNTVTGLATTNSGVLVTSVGGVPSISTTLPSSLAMGTPASLTLTNASGLLVAGGGTGLDATTAYAVLCGGTTTTGALQSIAALGSAGARLTSAGAGALPTMKGGLTAFRAYRNTAQSIPSATFTKISLDTESFDTGSMFDSATNFRFTPTIAGYYQIDAKVQFDAVLASGDEVDVLIYKNGAAFATNIGHAVKASAYYGIQVSSIIQFNGSTDYVELYVYQSNASSKATLAGSPYNYMSGVLVEAT